MKVNFLEEEDSYLIVWEHNNCILPRYNNAIRNKTVNLMDQGYYSCAITNTFGTSHCGSIFVEVFRNIEFSNEPQDSVGYLNSLKRTYLTCAIKK